MRRVWLVVWWAILAALWVPAAQAQTTGTEVVFTLEQLEVFAREADTDVTITDLSNGSTYTSFTLASEGDRWRRTSGVPHYVAVTADKPVTLFSGRALDQRNDWTAHMMADNNTEFGRSFHGFTASWVWVFVPRAPGDISSTEVHIDDYGGDDEVVLDEYDAVVVTPRLEVYARSGFENEPIRVECSRDCLVQVGSPSVNTSTGWSITPPSIAKGEDGREVGTRFVFYGTQGMAIWPYTDGTEVTITDLSDQDDSDSFVLDADQFYTRRNLTGETKGLRDNVHAGNNYLDNDYVLVETSQPVSLYVGPTQGGGFTMDFTAGVPTGPGRVEAHAYADDRGVVLLTRDPPELTTLDTVAGNGTHGLSLTPDDWLGVGPYYWDAGGNIWNEELVEIVADKPFSVFYGDMYFTLGCCSASFVPVVPGGETRAPVAEAGVSVLACPYDTIVFDGTASFDQDDVGGDPDITAYSWDFDTATNADAFGDRDDDAQSTEPVGEWTYPTSDTYEVRLEVTDNDGQVDDDFVEVVIDVDQVELCGPDDDDDGVGAINDNCDDVFNPDQLDNNDNGIGDACDPDLDGDGEDNDVDNCPDVPNPEQTNTDLDDQGDACDPDDDGDGVDDPDDNCPLVPNDQSDLDEDGIGDACDDDRDGDGTLNAEDVCPDVADDQTNTDGLDDGGDACDPDDDEDGEPDATDNCRLVPNPDQVNSDDDLAGDACDDDDDDDGILDGADTCPVDADPSLRDTDGDGLGDVCDPDDDDDGHDDDDDNCPLVANPDQADADTDGEGDACDGDTDGDGIPDAEDDCPEVANVQGEDLDDDGLGDACDLDTDGDGVLDTADNCALAANAAQLDTDGDGLGDACDDDDDGDGVVDDDDSCPLVANPDQVDTDDDGQGDPCDGDRDGDELVDAEDNCPGAANPDQADFDEDGLGDACDPDADDDAVLDYDDNCLLVPNHVQIDTDGDGDGDACDDDDDGDGILDEADNCPQIPNPDQSDLDDDGAGDFCDGTEYLAGTGCGCASTGGGAGLWPLVLLGLAWRRRRT